MLKDNEFWWVVAAVGLSLVVLYSMTACAEQPERGAMVVYFKDYRTGLCFGAFSTGASNVPCTPEVEQLIRMEERRGH